MRFTRTRVRRAIIAGAASVTLALGTLVATTSPAQADDGYQYLVPDGGLYCFVNKPFGQQEQDAGWKVTFKKLEGGNTLANDAKCAYDVYIEAEVSLGVWPNYQTAMDWEAACNQQYPGSTLEWVFGSDAPWHCKAPADRHYSPPSDPSVTH